MPTSEAEYHGDKWEYLDLRFRSEGEEGMPFQGYRIRQLNFYGSVGWELVSMAYEPQPRWLVYCVMKRRKIDES